MLEVLDKRLEDVSRAPLWLRVLLAAMGSVVPALAWVTASYNTPVLNSFVPVAKEGIRWGIASLLFVVPVGGTLAVRRRARPRPSATPIGKLGIWLAAFDRDDKDHQGRLWNQLSQLIGQDAALRRWPRSDGGRSLSTETLTVHGLTML